jgi:peptidoglycan/LPS O-acetylase OafA/YrhL
MFNPRANGLNFLRLVLATTVIVWHAYPLSGHDIGVGPIRQFLEAFPVDGFFAISGFLIARSWVRRPHVRVFLSARALRIFPGFVVCLVVTAGILAPIGILLTGTGFPRNYLGAAVGYVVKNLSLNMVQYDIAGTPTSVPYPEVWDGSLWTLRWEFLCYLAIMLLGLLGLLKRPAAVVAIYLANVGALIAVALGLVTSDAVTDGSRLATMFFAGALVYLAQGWLPSGVPWLVGAGVVVAASLWIPHYQIVAAPFLAYALVNVGARITTPKLRFNTDISYGVYIYAFPVAQILAGVGMVTAPIPAFILATVVVTLPLATASWFVVEKPALRWKASTQAREPRRIA